MPKKIETNIDTLVDAINRRGEMTLSDAAKLLNMKVNHVEAWVYILDKNKEETGIEFYYPPFKEPIIRTSKHKNSTFKIDTTLDSEFERLLLGKRRYRKENQCTPTCTFSISGVGDPPQYKSLTPIGRQTNKQNEPKKEQTNENEIDIISVKTKKTVKPTTEESISSLDQTDILQKILELNKGFHPKPTLEHVPAMQHRVSILHDRVKTLETDVKSIQDALDETEIMIVEKYAQEQEKIENLKEVKHDIDLVRVVLGTKLERIHGMYTELLDLENPDKLLKIKKEIDTIGNNYDTIRAELISTKLDTIKEQQDDLLKQIRESKY